MDTTCSHDLTPLDNKKIWIRSIEISNVHVYINKTRVTSSMIHATVTLMFYNIINETVVILVTVVFITTKNNGWKYGKCGR